MIVEVCANSLQSALHAERAGAQRIELCCELGVGGITPSHGLLQQVRDAVAIPIHVLIRPRSGDFTYSSREYETMLADIAHCESLGFDGIVSGVLRHDLRLDRERTAGLIARKGKMHFTFHRAFDWIPEPLEALAQLEALGVNTLLSSGQQQRAVDGMPLLCQLREQASQCTIMPGGGIHAGNALQFREQGFRAIHLSAARLRGNLSLKPRLSMNSPAYISDETVAVSDEAVIRAVVEAVK